MKKFMWLTAALTAIMLIFNVIPVMAANPSTGLANSAASDGGWYYYTNGKIDTSVTTVARNENGWWYVRDGKVRFDYNGAASNNYGTWFIRNGKVNWNDNGVIYSPSDKNWYYVRNSEVQTGYTGIRQNNNGWWRIVNGKVDFNCNSVEQNEYGWWVIRGGKVQFGYNGFADNKHGTWYCQGGKVRFDTNSIIYGNVNGTNAWWHVVNGKVVYDTTVASNENGWWYVKNGKVDFGFTGVSSNQYGTWRIEGGKVNFGYNGRLQEGDTEYTISGGKVVSAKSTHKHSYTIDVTQTRQVWVIDKPAYDKQELIADAYYEFEEVWDYHTVCDCGYDYTQMMYDMGYDRFNDEVRAAMQAHMNETGHGGSATARVKIGTNTIYHEAEYATVHHEEEGHYEDVKFTVEDYKCSVCGAVNPAAHIHTWEATYQTVHHDAVYENTVWHDAGTEERWVVTSPEHEENVYAWHTVCGCGYDYDAAEAETGLSFMELYRAHCQMKYNEETGEFYPMEEQDDYEKDEYGMPKHTGLSHRYVMVGTQTVPEEGYYETVTIEEGYWDQKLVSEAWDEMILTGFKCSRCGAAK